MRRALLWTGCLALLVGAPAAGAAAATATPAAAVRRVVSMNPSLTAMLLALGAGERLVGVDDWSARELPSVADLPRVGGLFNPNLESVVGLHPDLVVLVPSAEQRDFRARLRELDVAVLALDPVSFDQVLAAIRELGAAVGATEAADARVAAIRAARAEVERRAAGLPHPSVVLVLQREPLFIVGSGSFIDDMLAAVGARNLGAAFAEPYPRVGLEWLLSHAPDVLLDASNDPPPPERYWQRWPSLAGAVRPLPAGAAGAAGPAGPPAAPGAAGPAANATLPGPWLDRALWTLARAVHGDAFASRAP